MKATHAIKILFFLLLGASACLDDRSSLAERELSGITISAVPDTLTVYFGEEFVLDHLEIRQSGEALPLTYEWSYGSLNVVEGVVQPYPIKDSLRLVSRDPKIRYAFRELGTFGLRLKVDNGEDVCFKYFILRVDTEFAEGITILSRDERGKGRLSFLKTLSGEETGAGVEPSFRADVMELINPMIQLEDVTDMMQVRNRLLICSGKSGRIYNLDARTFDVESMTSFREKYPACSFKNFMGITVQDNMYLSSDDRKAYVYDCVLNELTLTRYAEALALDGAAAGARPIFVDHERSVLYSPKSSGGFYNSSKHYSGFNILQVCYIGNVLYVVATYQAMPSLVFLAATSWSFHLPDILQFTEGPKSFVLDRDAIFVGSQQYKCIYFTSNNEIYRWDPPRKLPETPVLRLPAGMMITTLATDPAGKFLYVGVYAKESTAGRKGSLFVYDAKTLVLVNDYREIADRPVRIIYKTRE